MVTITKNFLIMVTSLQHARFSFSTVYNSAYFCTCFICVYCFKLINDDFFQQNMCGLTVLEFPRGL